MVRGLLDLYEASQESSWLEWALRLQDTQDRLFWDSRGGGYFCSEAEPGVDLPLRLKDGQCGCGPALGPSQGRAFPEGNFLILCDFGSHLIFLNLLLNIHTSIVAVFPQGQWRGGSSCPGNMQWSLKPTDSLVKQECLGLCLQEVCSVW